MGKLMLGTWALAAGVASAMSGKMCQNMTLQVPTTARNGVFGNTSLPTTDLEATRLALFATRQGFNATDLALTGYQTISNTYPIAATYCMPADQGAAAGMSSPMSSGEAAPSDDDCDECDTSGGSAASSGASPCHPSSGSSGTSGASSSGNHTLQILTHGIGFDRSYWDLPYHSFNYSYVDVAVSHGYHTLTYDRLGIGESAHGDPLNEIQAFLEVEALAKMTRMIRSGSLPGIPSKPAKIVHGGHSFGSTQTYALTAKYPDISDGIVLTGFSTKKEFLPYFIAGSNFVQFKTDRDCQINSMQQPVHSDSYDLGYLSSDDVGNTEYLFFYPGHFDVDILYFAELHKQPVTPGELLTIASLPKMSSFPGPVLVVTGDHDLPFCGGDCYNTGGKAPSIPAEAAKAFPSASSFEAYPVPNSGHGINLHYTSVDAYNKIMNWLAKTGLTA